MLMGAVDWVRKGSYHTAWAVPCGSSCSCSYAYGRGPAIGPHTGGRCWPLLAGVWRAIALLMKPWCAEGEVPTAAKMNLYRGWKSCARWRCDDEPLLGQVRSRRPLQSHTHFHPHFLLARDPYSPCEDSRQSGISAEYQPLTGCEPERIELNRTLFNLSNQEIDDQHDIEEVSRVVFVLFLGLHGSSGSWSDGGSWSSKSDKSSNSWKSYQVCESCNNWVYEHRAQNVNRTPTQTACTDAHSVSQHKLNSMITCHHANTRGSSAQLRDCTSFVSSKQLSSTWHVSFLAAPDTDHKHKFSITHLSYLSDGLSLTPKSFGARSIFTLLRFTGEWRINTNPISHRL